MNYGKRYIEEMAVRVGMLHCGKPPSMAPFLLGAKEGSWDSESKSLLFYLEYTDRGHQLSREKKIVYFVKQ